jgi:hypothetical protein
MVKARSDMSSKKKRAAKPKQICKKGREGSYKGIEWESFEELSFLYWAFELKNHGYIKSIRRSPSFLLSDSMVHDYVVNLKTKSKPASELVMHGHSYTPEFVIEWDKKAFAGIIDLTYQYGKYENRVLLAQTFPSQEGVWSYVEIKPMFDQNSMERLFKVNQKWMWQKHGIYVNLIKVGELFPKTFTPEEYLRTPTGKPRKLNWKPKSLFDFLKGG